MLIDKSKISSICVYVPNEELESERAGESRERGKECGFRPSGDVGKA